MDLAQRVKSWAKPAVKAFIGALVVVAVGRHVVRTWRDLSAHEPPPRFDGFWLCVSVPVYIAGLTAFGAFYARVLRSSPSPLPAGAAIRAYLISHLGKYVPGKALVVVMRAGMSAQAGARAATAAFATLYETLLMMAAGGLIAGLGFAITPARVVRVELGPLGAWPVPLALLGLAAGLGFLVLIEGRVFPRLSRLASLPFPGVGPDALPTLSWRLIGEGMLWSLLGWTLLGLSQVAIIQAIAPSGLPVALWPVAIASVALATVAGFVVPVAPGGLGVREWVLWTALGSVLDPGRSVIAALALRLSWVIGEVLAALVLAPLRPVPTRPVTSLAP